MSTPDMDKILELSDEEFSKLSQPPAPVSAKSDTGTEQAEQVVPEESAAESEAAPAASESSPVAEEATEEAPVAEGKNAFEDDGDEEVSASPDLDSDSDSETETESKTDAPTEQPKKADAAEPVKSKAGAADTDTAAATDSTGIDYKSFYERVMAPFKANGKQIQLQSPDEVIQLMQMGANYTKKMQALQSHKKYVMMLENNGLLDEEKISFLIDLDKKNPEAIKKLLKDANIDPIEVDTSKVNYRSGSHAVSDQEAALTSAIEDLNAQDGGADTLQSIQSWDPASKKALWTNPELLTVFHAQRVNGIYDRITSEIERRKLLGQIPASMPFLSAYKTVGDELVARGAFQSGAGTAQPAAQAPRPVAGAPVAVRPAKTPVATKTPDNRVKAAAPTRAAPRTAQPSVNYLAMSDEEFLKLAKKV